MIEITYFLPVWTLRNTDQMRILPLVPPPNSWIIFIRWEHLLIDITLSEKSNPLWFMWPSYSVKCAN